MTRSVACLLAALALSACASQPKGWQRADAKPSTPDQLALDETVCRGEMQKSRLSSTMEAGISIGPNGLYSPKAMAVEQVYDGCMAQRGWVHTGP